MPVRLFSAVRDLDLHFTQLHEKDGAPIETKRFCSKEDREVGYDEIARAYDFDDERGTVVVTDEELATVAPRKTRTIEIEAFVDVAEIDPIHFDHPYFLAPAGDTEGTLRAYQLLVEAMAEHRSSGARALRDADEGVPRGGARPRGAPDADDDAVRRRDPAGNGHHHRREETDQEAARRRGRADRGAGGRLEPGRLRGPLPRAARGGRRAQAQGPDDRAPEEEEQPAPVADLLAALEESLQEARARRGGGGGNGASRDGDALEDLSRDELYERAQEEGVEGRSSMSKEDLVKALRG